MKQISSHKRKLLKASKQPQTRSDYLYEYLSSSWHPYVLIIVIGILVFGKTLWFGYTYFDDDLLILKRIDYLNNISGIFQSFNTLYLGPYFRPFITISLILDAQISHAAPWMYHISNLLFHLTAGSLTFFLLLKLQVPKLTALFAGIIFILHPLATQTVAWIPGRNESLLAVFIISSFIFFIYSLSSGKYYFYFLHNLFFYIALFTKESALIFPLIVLLYYVLVVRKSLFSIETIKYIIGWLPGIILWYFLRRSALTGIQLNPNIFSFKEAITNVPAMIEILGKLVFPVRLSVYPTIHIVSIILGLIAITTVTVFIIILKRKINRVTIFSLLWIVLFLLPSLIVNIQDTQNRFSYLETRGYISIIGFVILLASMYGMWLNSLVKNIIKVILPIIVLYSIITLIYSTSYRSPLDYWKQAVEMSPQTSDTYYNLGLASSQIYSDADMAEKNFRQAIALNNGNSFYHNCLGVIYGQKNLPEMAENELNISINLNPTDPDPYTNLGYLKYINNHFAEAEQYYKKSISIDANYLNAYYKLIILYNQEKRYDESLHLVDILKSKGYEFDPTFVEEIKSRK